MSERRKRGGAAILPIWATFMAEWKITWFVGEGRAEFADGAGVVMMYEVHLRAMGTGKKR
jgi:hypothetical protein